jgi:hypothetical protein
MIKLSPERAEAVKKIIVEQLREVAYGTPDAEGVMTTFTFTMAPNLAESRKIVRRGKSAVKRKNAP